MKKHRKVLAVCIFGAMCTVASSVNAFAALGSVKATAGFGYNTNPSTLNYTFYGNGKAIEQVASTGNTTNIYAKTTVMRSDNVILAWDEYTDHNVSTVEVSCTTPSMAVTYDKYYTTTLARARYIDNSVSQNTAQTTPRQFLFEVRSLNVPVNTIDEEYDFIPSSSFINTGDSVNTLSEFDTSDPSAVELIFGDHFMELQVGDTMPSGVYVSKDGSKCYIIDKKANGSEIKTTYTISGINYTVDSVETI